MNTNRIHHGSLGTACFALFAAALGLPIVASALDWSGVPEREVVLFYPGQASWEWALTEKDHSGAPKFREGKNCSGCHDGEQADIGATIVSGKKLEPAPIAGKPGHLALKVQVAHDADRLHFRLRWKSGPASGDKLDPKYASRVTVMLGDAAVKEAPRAGCWASCHDDAKGMASAAADSKMTKYLGSSRAKLSRQGGGEALKPDADQKALQDAGAFLQYWQAGLNPDQAAQASSGWILDARHRHDPAITMADAQFANGEWTVDLSGPLKDNGLGKKMYEAGKTYAVGFAIHDDFTDHRFHHVSLEHSLVIDSGTADFVAKAK